jgi:murein DD-endopeptidase MepM/ murein hydrolase activator NlpD
MSRHAAAFLGIFLLAYSPVQSVEIAKPSETKIVPDINKPWRQPRGTDSPVRRSFQSLLKVREQIYYQHGSVAQGQLAQLLYKTPSYYPCGYVYTAELYPLSGDPDLYLHQKVNGTWIKLKESINGGSTLDSFTFTCSDITPSATNVDLDAKGYSPGTATYDFFLYREATAPTFSLRFPLGGRNAYTANQITAVFDHNMTTGNCPNGIVTAYTGEEGRSTYGSSSWNFPAECTGQVLRGLKKNPNDPSGTLFSINGQYTDALTGRQFLYYDGHTGYDYTANIGTTVLATADGTVTVEGGAYNTLRIDHGNGYSTYYLHLSQYLKTSGAFVRKGDPVALSGQKGVEGSPHLHVTIKKNGIRVDPYGWQGSYADPYTSLNGVQNIPLWEP